MRDKMKEIIQKIITLKVNGTEYDIKVGTGRDDMPESETLAHTLRDRLGMTGLKIGCDQGACGCCTVIMDGKAVTSCLTLTMDCDGAEITTIEGLADRATGELDGLQQAFLDNCGYQCGFCIPGVIMTAKALLNENPEPTEEEVNEEISKMAEMYKMEADKLKELLGDRELEQMKKDMAVQKVVTLVADEAKEA